MLFVDIGPLSWLSPLKRALSFALKKRYILVSGENCGKVAGVKIFIGAYEIG